LRGEQPYSWRKMSAKRFRGAEKTVREAPEMTSSFNDGKTNQKKDARGSYRKKWIRGAV